MKVFLIGLLLMTGCATTQKQVYLWDGESVIINGEGKLKITLNEDEVTIKSEIPVNEFWADMEGMRCK